MSPWVPLIALRMQRSAIVFVILTLQSAFCSRPRKLVPCCERPLYSPCKADEGAASISAMASTPADAIRTVRSLILSLRVLAIAGMKGRFERSCAVLSEIASIAIGEPPIALQAPPLALTHLLPRMIRIQRPECLAVSADVACAIGARLSDKTTSTRAIPVKSRRAE